MLVGTSRLLDKVYPALNKLGLQFVRFKNLLSFRGRISDASLFMISTTEALADVVRRARKVGAAVSYTHLTLPTMLPV